MEKTREAENVLNGSADVGAAGMRELDFHEMDAVAGGRVVIFFLRIHNGVLRSFTSQWTYDPNKLTFEV